MATQEGQYTVTTTYSDDGNGSLSAVRLNVSFSGETGDSLPSLDLSSQNADFIAHAGDVGAYIGSQLALLLQSNSALENVVIRTGLSTVGQLISQEIASLNLTGTDLTAAAIGTNFETSFSGAIGGYLGGQAGAALFKALGLPPGLGQVIGATIGSAVVTYAVQNTAESLGLTEAGSSADFLADLSSNLSSLAVNVFELVTGLNPSVNVFGGSPQDVQIGESIGGLIGTIAFPELPVLGTVIGQFVGSIIGSLFGHPSVGPGAGVNITVQTDDAGLVTFLRGQVGGDNKPTPAMLETIASLGQSVTSFLNGELDALGGSIGSVQALEFVEFFQGQFYDSLSSSPSTKFPNETARSFGTDYNNVLNDAVIRQLQLTQVFGADPALAAAMSNSFLAYDPTYASDALGQKAANETIADLNYDLQAVYDYNLYRSNPVAFLLGYALRDANSATDWPVEMARGALLQRVYTFDEGQQGFAIDNFSSTNDGSEGLLEISGVIEGSVTASRSGDNLLLTSSRTGQTVTIQSFFTDAAHEIGQVRFLNSDNSVAATWSGRDIDSAVGAAGDGTTVFLYGSPVPLLLGTSGNDELISTSGPAEFDGLGAPSETSDFEQGGGGGDVFHYNPGYGHLEISDVSSSGIATAVLELGPTAQERHTSVSLDRNGNVVVRDGLSGDYIQIDQMSGLGSYGVSAIKFSDGTIWTAAQIVSLAEANLQRQVAADEASKQQVTPTSSLLGIDPAAPSTGGGGVWQSASLMHQGDVAISPLVLDLSGTGLNLTPLSAASPYFDLTGSGFATKTGWIGNGSGLLAIDPTDSGQITSIAQLFGTANGYANGFAALLALDTNGNGLIDPGDEAWSQLRVWVNPEGDGVVHPGELATLDELGIQSISLNAVASNQDIGGNTVGLAATYTLANGTQQTIGDVWFQTSPTYTQADVATNISIEASKIPELSGYGSLRDLQSAATLDPTLLSEVQSVTTDVSQNAGAILEDVKTLMLEWSSSTGVDPDSAGNNQGGGPIQPLDARELDFLEKYTGLPFYNQSYNASYVRWNAAISIEEAWNAAFDGVVSRLVLQAGYDLPEFAYNQDIDAVVPTNSIQASFVSLYSRLGGPTATNTIQWDVALRVADGLRSDLRLDSATYLAQVAAASSTSIASFASTYIYGLSYAADSTGRYVVSGTTRDATIYAGQAIREIQITGGDTATPAPLDNTIFFSASDGHLELDLTDYSPTPETTLKLGAGIDDDDLTASWDGDRNLILTDAVTGNVIQIDGQDSTGLVTQGSGPLGDSHQAEIHGISQVVFADGTTLDRTALRTLATTGTTSADRLIGDSDSSVFDGKGAPAGNQDYEQGSGSTDTFVYKTGYGALEINDDLGRSSMRNRTLELGAGITPANATFTSDASGNVYVSDGTAGDQVKIDQMLASGFLGGRSEFGVDRVVFGDGTVWTSAQVANAVLSSNATVFNLLPGGSSVTFNGSTSNVVNYNAGDGAAVINLNGAAGVINLGPGITAKDLTFNADDAGDLTVTIGSAGDSILINGNLYAGWSSEQARLGNLALADGSTISLDNLTFTQTGTAETKTLTGSNWGANVFNLAPGGDTITFGNGQGDGSNQNTVTYNVGDGALTINPNGGAGAVSLGAGITASELSYSADSAGDLTITIGNTGDSILINGELYQGWTSEESRIQSLSLADGSTVSLSNFTFVQTASAGSTVLTGSGWGANVFDLSPGGDTVTLGGGQNGGSNQNTVNYAVGDGAATINLNGGVAAINLGAGITANELSYDADAAGDLTIAIGNTGDSILINGDLYNGWSGVASHTQSLSLADGSSVSLSNFTFVQTASASDMVLTANSWGSNIFNLASGGDTINFGNGQNTVNYAAGDGAATINLNGQNGAINLGAGITADELSYNADAAGDLTIAIGNTGDSILINGDLYDSWGLHSRIQNLLLADGSTVSLSNFTFVQTASSSNTVLTANSWGSNIFNLAPGGDTINFGNGQNTVNYAAGDGAATINLNGQNGAINLGAGITADELSYNADAAGDLTIAIGNTGDSILINGDLYDSWGLHSRIQNLLLADGSSVSLSNFTFVQTASASNTVLTANHWGSNIFNLAPGGDTVNFGGGQNTVNYAAGNGAATINLNGQNGAINLGAGITADELSYNADAAGDLTITIGNTGDSILINGDLYTGWGGVGSNIHSLSLADGSSVNLSNLTFVQTASATNTMLMPNNWGSNIFNLASGGDTVNFGGGRNTVNYAAGDGAATVNLNGQNGTINLGTGITADELSYNADDAGNLTVVIGNTGDSILIEGDLYHAWNGVGSNIHSLSLDDGSSVNLSNFTFVQTASATNTVLTPNGWGSNIFNLAPGGDTVNFGGGQNTVNYAAGDGAATINLDGQNGAINLGTGITAGELSYSADAAGDLTIAIGNTGDSILINGDLFTGYHSVGSTISSLSLADGSSVSLNNLTFTETGTTTNTTLAGTSWGNTNFILGPGTDTILFGPTANTILFGEGSGSVIADLSQSSASAQGMVQLGSDVTEQNLWLTENGSDLVASILGSPDVLTIKNWFGSGVSTELGQFSASDGLKLDSQITNLVSAFATYQSSNPGFNLATASALPPDPTLQSAIRSAWHT